MKQRRFKFHQSNNKVQLFIQYTSTFFQNKKTIMKKISILNQISNAGKLNKYSFLDTFFKKKNFFFLSCPPSKLNNHASIQVFHSTFIYSFHSILCVQFSRRYLQCQSSMPIAILRSYIQQILPHSSMTQVNIYTFHFISFQTFFIRFLSMIQKIDY